MYSIERQELNHSDETYRVITTMLKKLQIGRRPANVTIMDTVSEIVWLSKILVNRPEKIVALAGSEELAKIIFYRTGSVLNFYDLYVNPRVRKQGLAKRLIAEALSVNGDALKISFYARESNKPARNLLQFFQTKFRLPQELITSTTYDKFFVDGSPAIVFEISFPTVEVPLEAQEA